MLKVRYGKRDLDMGFGARKIRRQLVSHRKSGYSLRPEQMAIAVAYSESTNAFTSNMNKIETPETHWHTMQTFSTPWKELITRKGKI